MAMVTLIEHKDWQGNPSHTVTVREDLLMSFVACVKCKGTGNGWRCVGGNLPMLGWSMHQNFGCRQCRARGYWKSR